MKIEYATARDIEKLTELRLSYLYADFGELGDDMISAARRVLPEYFKNHLNRDIFCYLMREGEEVAACAFLLVVEKPLSPLFATGKIGIVMNVYTHPDHRRKGYARSVIEKLLADAREKNLSSVELQATAAGYPLYKSVGFKDEEGRYRNMSWENADAVKG